MSYTIEDLAAKVNGTVLGESKTAITGVTGFEHPKTGCVTFISSARDLKELEKSDISCILVPRLIRASSKPLIQVENPKLAFAILIGLFHPPRDYKRYISDKADIAKSAILGKNVTIEAFVHIGENTRIGDNAVIRASSYIDDRVEIGEGTVIHPNASIYDQVKIGSRVIIHSGVVIGADGFGFVFDGKQQFKLPQVGTVTIDDDVEIGACSTIDRAALGNTIIGKGTKIDNQVQIAHNVQIGAHCAISAQVGISGSCKIGNYVVMGGSVGLADHVEVGDGAMLGANAGVPSNKKIPPKSIWFGQPARPYEEMRKQVGAQLRAYENQEDLRSLKKEFAKLNAEIEALRAKQQI